MHRHPLTTRRSVHALRGGALESSQLICEDGALRLELGLEPSLSPAQVALRFRNESDLENSADVFVGDVLIVQGQSNAVARMFVGSAADEMRPYVRSFGTRSPVGTVVTADTQWHEADGDLNSGPGAIGQWALRMASQTAELTGIPLAVFNHAVGGQPIAFFQRNDDDPEDITTNYGQLLFRLRAAGLDESVRAIMFYQGENDRNDFAAHRAGYTSLQEDWREDYSSVEQFYITQLRRGCGGPRPEFLQAQVELTDSLENTSIMSTTHLSAHDGCHFGYENGYQRLGDDYRAWLLRDLYGEALEDVEPPRAVRLLREDDLVTIELEGDFTELSVNPDILRFIVTEPESAMLSEPTIEGSTLTFRISGGLRTVGFPMQGNPVSNVENARGVGMLGFSLSME